MNLGHHKVHCDLFFLFKPWNSSTLVSIFYGPFSFKLQYWKHYENHKVRGWGEGRGGGLWSKLYPNLANTFFFFLIKDNISVRSVFIGAVLFLLLRFGFAIWPPSLFFHFCKELNVICLNFCGTVSYGLISSYFQKWARKTVEGVLRW